MPHQVGQMLQTLLQDLMEVHMLVPPRGITLLLVDLMKGLMGDQEQEDHLMVVALPVALVTVSGKTAGIFQDL